MTDAAVSYRLLDQVLRDIAEREGNTRTLGDALYVLSAIARNGLVVIPAEPTSAMIDAASRQTGLPAATIRAVIEAIMKAAD
ncbi:MAG: hypothetical protein RL477_531 [Pseudomonadota bacterium]|jgi:3-deoxy-D-manno-octulosonate 8-phosphate phosphatase KdsC-like HAD superfamily phosphatase